MAQYEWSVQQCDIEDLPEVLNQFEADGVEIYQTVQVEARVIAVVARKPLTQARRAGFGIGS